ncbi:MAG: response regulator [Flavitalea sp.]
MSNIQNKFVLCVDDDLDDRLVICDAIRDVDPTLQVVQACNGIEANQFLQCAKSTGNFPCLVILDMNMPLMDGRETLKQIKMDETLKNLSIVFFTTSSNPRDQSFSVEYGVEFVTKPSNYSSIVATFKDLLTRCNG